MKKLSKEDLKRLIMEEVPSGKRGPGIRFKIEFDIVPGFDEKVDMNNLRAQIRNMLAGLKARVVSANHETEVSPSNASITMDRA